MVFVFDGGSFHYAHVRNFDLLKAFGYFERVVKSDFVFGADLFYIIRAHSEMSNHLI